MTANKPPPKRRGRPRVTLKTPADYAVLSEPGTLASKAEALNMSAKTLHKLIKTDPKAADAHSLALYLEREAIEQALLTMALDVGATGNKAVSAAALLLKTRHGVESDAPATAVQINLPAPMGAKDYEKLVSTIPQKPAAALEHDPRTTGPSEPISFQEMLTRTGK